MARKSGNRLRRQQLRATAIEQPLCEWYHSEDRNGCPCGGTNFQPNQSIAVDGLLYRFAFSVCWCHVVFLHNMLLVLSQVSSAWDVPFDEICTKNPIEKPQDLFNAFLVHTQMTMKSWTVLMQMMLMNLEVPLIQSEESPLDHIMGTLQAFKDQGRLAELLANEDYHRVVMKVFEKFLDAYVNEPHSVVVSLDAIRRACDLIVKGMVRSVQNLALDEFGCRVVIMVLQREELGRPEDRRAIRFRLTQKVSIINSSKSKYGKEVLKIMLQMGGREVWSLLEKATCNDKVRLQHIEDPFASYVQGGLLQTAFDNAWLEEFEKLLWHMWRVTKPLKERYNDFRQNRTDLDIEDFPAFYPMKKIDALWSRYQKGQMPKEQPEPKGDVPQSARPQPGAMTLGEGSLAGQKDWPELTRTVCKGKASKEEELPSSWETPVATRTELAQKSGGPYSNPAAAVAQHATGSLCHVWEQTGLAPQAVSRVKNTFLDFDVEREVPSCRPRVLSWPLMRQLDEDP